MENPHDILGVATDADLKAIRRAYRELVRANHPDVAGAESTQKMKQINAAFEAARAAQESADKGVPGADPARPAGAAATGSAYPGERPRNSENPDFFAAGIRKASSSGFGRRASPEVVTENRMDRRLDEEIKLSQRADARDSMLAKRRGDHSHEPVRAYHKAQKVSLDDGVINIHLGSRAEAGRNAVVAPVFSQKGRDVVMEDEVKVLDVSLDRGGRQGVRGAEKILMKDGDRKVVLHFSDQKENLRAHQRQTRQAG